MGEEPLLGRRETVKEVIGLEAELEGGGLGNGLGVLENVGSDAEKGKVEWGQKGCWEVKGRGRGYRREISGFGRIGGSGGKSVVLKASMGTVAHDDDAVGLFLRVNEFQKSGRKRRLQ